MDELNVETDDKAASLNLDNWINGVTTHRRNANVIQRGDLIKRLHELGRELEVQEQVEPEERGVGDEAPESLQSEIEQIEREVWDSTIVVTVEDRTEIRRTDIREKQKKKGVQDYTVLGLHVIADAIVMVKTTGGEILAQGYNCVSYDQLATIRTNAGDVALLQLNSEFNKLISTAPEVSAPLSRGSSSTSSGATSQRRAKRRKRGGSRRG